MQKSFFFHDAAHLQHIFNRSPRPVTEPSWKSHRSPTPKTKLPTAKVSQEYNWQASQNSVRERNAVMYNNPLMADVWFSVGTAPNVQKIPAHKYVLAVGSSVFNAMFYGGLADHQEAVELPDVEPAAFQNLLRYCMSCDMRKPVFGVSNQVRHKPDCTTSEDG